MLRATSAKSPNAKSENPIVSTPSELRSGARRDAFKASRSASILLCSPGRRRPVILERTAYRRLPDERSVSCLRWRLVRGVEDDASVVQLHRTEIGAANHLQIVRRHHNRRAAGVDVLQQLEHTACCSLVEISRWLVGKNEIGLVHECTGNRNALLLTARKMSRKLIGLGCQTDLVQNSRDFLRDLRLRRSRHLQRERHILLGGAVVEQAEFLEHDSKFSPELRNLLAIGGVGMKAVHPHVTVAWLLLHVEESQNRSLSGAAGADEKDELAALHLKGHVAQRHARASVLLRSEEHTSELQSQSNLV